MSKRSKKKRKNWTASSPTWMVAGSVGKGNKVDYDNWRNRGFYSPTYAAPTEDQVRRGVLEEIADDILKTDSMVFKKTKRRTKRKAAPRSNSPAISAKDEFYASWEWRKLRMQVLKLQGARCQCCGATPDDRDMAGKPVKMTVDHIKPLSKYWDLRFQRSNLQVLCDECNQGKSNWCETDFRRPALREQRAEPRRDTSGVSAEILDQLTDKTTGTLQ